MTSEHAFAFTVFTPSYNRRHTLARVYESLRAQTFRDFEWLIIDDGSSDGTGDLVAEWAKTSDFAIQYIYQPNGGKNSTYRPALEAARGTLFLTLDSDDECVPEALERFKHHWDAIPEADREAFSAVTARCRTPDGRPVGDSFPRPVLDSDSLELLYRYKVRGEKWGFHRVDVLKQYPFPTFEKCKYVPEGVIWQAIARRYKTRFVNEYLRTYHMETINNFTTSVGTSSKYAAGYLYYFTAVLNEDLNWIRYDPASFFKSAANYTRFSLHEGLGIAPQARALRGAKVRLLWLGTFPVGVALYLRDCHREKRLRMAAQA